MQQMITFSSWVLQQIPSFLMAEPMCYFVGLIMTIAIFTLIIRIFNSK